MKLIFASHNENKTAEIRQLLPAGIELLSLNDLNFQEEIKETSDTNSFPISKRKNLIAFKFCKIFDSAWNGQKTTLVFLSKASHVQMVKISIRSNQS